MWRFKNTESKSLHLQPHTSSLGNGKQKGIHENFRWLPRVCIRIYCWLHEHTLSFFLTCYLWTRSVQFRALWKASSRSVSHCALRVTVRFRNHDLRVSVPQLYSGSDPSSWRSCEEEVKFAKVLQRFSREKSKRGTIPPRHLEQGVHKQTRDHTGEKGIELLLIFSILPSGEMRQESSGEKIKKKFIPNEASPTFYPQSWTHLPSIYRMHF